MEPASAGDGALSEAVCMRDGRVCFVGPRLCCLLAVFFGLPCSFRDGGAEFWRQFRRELIRCKCWLPLPPLCSPLFLRVLCALFCVEYM